MIHILSSSDAHDLLRLMRSLNAAWNERRWNDYGDLFSDELIAYSSYEVLPHGKPEQLRNAQMFCATFPDARVAADRYDEIFSDGQKTCSVAHLTGSTSPDLMLPTGERLAGHSRRFDITTALICTWHRGRVIDLREYINMDLLMRQLRRGSFQK